MVSLLRRSFLLILVATSLWGASSAFLAHESVGLAGGGIVALAGGATLLSLAAFNGTLRRTRASVPVILPLGVLEAVNLGFYVLALKYGSVPIAVATHLSAPLILMSAAITTGARKFRRRELMVVSLVLMGIAMIALAEPNSSGSALLGAGLGFLSALALALLISRVAAVAPSERPEVAAGWQLLVAGLLLLPLAATDWPTSDLLIYSVAIGAALLGPGFYFYWRSMRELDASTASVLGLNEAIVAGILAWLVGTGTPSALDLLGAVAILGAIALEITESESSG